MASQKKDRSHAQNRDIAHSKALVQHGTAPYSSDHFFQIFRKRSPEPFWSHSCYTSN